MVNFKIVENDDKLEQVHDDFLQMYHDGVRVKTIQEKLGLSESQYQNFRYRLMRRGEITQTRNPHGGAKKERRHERYNPKNYTWNRRTQKFHIIYCGRFYCSFEREEDAKRYVLFMRGIGWDYERRYEVKELIMND